MPFHVEITSSPNHARSFNLDETRLWKEVLEPWIVGLPFEFGEQEWEPRASRLTVLEGPALAGPDLSLGQGWFNALRASEDVTRSVLEAADAKAPAQSAATIEADSLEKGLTLLASGRQPRPVQWASAVERINGRDPEIAAVILVLKPQPGLGFP